MGLIENGTQDPESNVIEPLNTSENLAQDPKHGPLTPPIYRMETMEQKEVTGSQSSGKNIGSVEEISDQIKETGPNPEDLSQNLDAEKEDPPLESAKTFSGAQNLEVTSQNGLTNLENICISPEAASANPGYGKLETVQIDETNNSGQLDTEDRGCSVQSRKRKAGLKSPVASSWVLRSKSQEKPKAPEPNENVKEDSANVEKKKRGRKKKPMQKTTVNEFSRTKTHLRYLLHRIKYEQSLIDAYSAEGWKGQSLDKLKPEKELQRAKSHILRYKLKIRALFQRLDMSLAVGKLPESLFDSHGEIDSEDVSKWFENARWSFHHRSRVGSNSAEKPPEPQPTISTDNHSSNQNVEIQESSAIRTREHITEAKVDNLVTNSCKENSGTRDTRKRRAKIDPPLYDIHVDDKTQEQQMLVDMRSPQPCSSKRQTRSSNSVA
ncbi:UNVERIFIED_CONTAM: Pathogenesis-related homeodomain protein [Sesamum calycinum]|uniref:Pathogenesis-related homeodomain protein n=1 Tax=Sesamum calycinum TaxID=2727403 RepID=A0AAW2PR35_9LAMI